MADTLEEFIAENKIDEKAANSLRNESEAVQAEVIKTDMKGVRNTSAFAINRMKQAKAAEKIKGPKMDSETIEAFITDNDLDEKAAKELRNQVPSIQREVIEKGDLSTARNKSSALISRIRDAKKYNPFLLMGAADPEAVERFLAANNIDDRASKALRELSSPMQNAVMKEPMDDCANKSSALMARIARACSGKKGDGKDSGGNKGMEDMMKAMMGMGGMGGMGGMMGGMMPMGGMMEAMMMGSMMQQAMMGQAMMGGKGGKGMDDMMKAMMGKGGGKGKFKPY